MAQLGTLSSGAGVVTTFAGLSQLDEFIVIGDPDTTNPIQAFQAEVNGETLININNQSLITAFMKWLMETVGSVTGLMLKVATGRIKGNTTLRFTNSGATTPAIYTFSDSDGGLPFIVTPKTILVGSYEDFSGFNALFATAPANVGSAVVTFKNGYTATVSAVELAAYFALNNQAEADGYLGGVLAVDNSPGNIENIRLFATGANLNVMTVQIPNQ